MTPQLIAWSHSRNNTYVDCAKQFHELNVLKSVPYEQGEPQKEGVRVHEALERRLANGIALPEKYARYERLIQTIIDMPGITYGERDMALDANLKPCGYFDKSTWVRATIDAIKLVPERRFAWFGDYKNGKVTVDEDQLKLYAAMGFHTFPEIDTIQTTYIFLQHNITPGKTYTRSQLPELWRELLPVPMAIQKAAATNYWPAKPSRKCGYCSVNKYGKCPEAAEKYRGS